MAHIEGLRIQNYRALKDIVLGKTTKDLQADVLPRMVTLIGPNGSGKSSIMDALGFLGDCLADGVEEACDKPHRGGFERVRTRGVSEPIQFEVYYRQETNARPISYTLSIGGGKDNRPIVEKETLRQARKGTRQGQLFPFLDLEQGKGTAWAGESSKESEGTQRIPVELPDRQRLGITTLGNLADHPRIVAFRAFLENWYLSYFVPDMARGLPMSGAQKHLDRTGQNLANYVQHMERSHSKAFEDVLERIGRKIPGVKRISTKKSDDGRILLQFNDRGYEDPFYAQDMSDGTLKMFAYLLLLEDPEPAPLIGIEEPENGLHHQLLEPLAKQMKDGSQKPNGPQIIVTTHSPMFVDALTPGDVWILEKDDSGHSSVWRASDIPTVKELAAEGIPLGSLWYSDHFDHLGRGEPVTFLEILVEGWSDVPTVKEILRRKFQLREGDPYRIHRHRGKGSLPTNPLANPDPKHHGLLDQLPKKLRGYGKSLPPDYIVVVLVDADNDDCRALKRQLVDLYNGLDSKPARVLFRIAVEETESWFLADKKAVKAGLGRVRLNKIPDVAPDSVIGAWETLAKALGRKPEECSGADKVEWAEAIAPHLDLDEPLSPSLRAFIQGVRDRVSEAEG
jgi:predicted ATPase